MRNCQSSPFFIVLKPSTLWIDSERLDGNIEWKSSNNTYLNKDFVVTLRLDSKIVVGPTAKQSNSSLDRGRGPEFESRQGMVN